MPSPPTPGSGTIFAAVILLSACAALATYLGRRSPRAWAVPAAIALLCFGFALAYDSFLPDDSYITYRYSQNLLAGHGMVFNLGERVLSTTTPLYTLLLVAAGVVWPDLPTTSHILSLAALFGGAMALYALLARHGKAVAGLMLAALYILNPLTAAVYSSESILHVALIFGVFLAYDQGRLNLAAALAALAVLNRGDGALVAVALGLHWLLTGGLRAGRGRALRALAVYATISLPWYFFSALYYGSLAPATLSAKIAQGELPNAPLFGPGIGIWWMAYAGQNPVYWLIPPLALLGLLLVFPRNGDRWAAPTVLWGGLYTVGYILLGVTRYQNYYTPLAPALLLLTMLGAHWFGVALASIPRHALRTPHSALRNTPFAPLILGIAIAAGFFVTGAGLYQRLPQPRAVIDEQVGRWLKQNTPAGASVGMLEVGVMGYYAERRVIDFYGLLQPDVAQHLARNDGGWAPRHYQPDYIVMHPPLLVQFFPPGDTWFTDHYRPVQTFENARCVELATNCSPMVIYERK
ncbi:MAG: hypothetical protein ACR2M0_00855 [Chloroflexia bacterium]